MSLINLPPKLGRLPSRNNKKLHLENNFSNVSVCLVADREFGIKIAIGIMFR
jgi:hypothetical protein